MGPGIMPRWVVGMAEIVWIRLSNGQTICFCLATGEVLVHSLPKSRDRDHLVQVTSGTTVGLYWVNIGAQGLALPVPCPTSQVWFIWSFDPVFVTVIERISLSSSVDCWLASIIPKQTGCWSVRATSLRRGCLGGSIDTGRSPLDRQEHF